MYDFLVKKGTTMAFLLGIVVIIIFLGSALSGLSSAGYDSGTDLVGMGKEAVSKMTFFDMGIILTIILAIAAVLLTLLFGVIQAVKFPKVGLKSLAALVGLGILFFILMSVSPSDIGEKMVRIKEEFKVTDGISNIIGGGILTTLVLSGIAVGAMVLFEIRNAFK